MAQPCKNFTSDTFIPDIRSESKKLPLGSFFSPEHDPIAERAKKAGVSAVVFDRNGFRYHGRIAAVADGAREGGLDF